MTARRRIDEAAFGVVYGSITVMAFSIDQIVVLGLLIYFGARIGWRVRGNVASALIGAGITGRLGLAISLMKYAIHRPVRPGFHL